MPDHTASSLREACPECASRERLMKNLDLFIKRWSPREYGDDRLFEVELFSLLQTAMEDARRPYIKVISDSLWTSAILSPLKKDIPL